jgi:transcriptional regulator with XRE-family HTH domain
LSPESVKFLEFVKVKRKQKGISVKNLASNASVSPQYIYHLELGMNSPTISTASKILSALNESWESFINYAREAA